MSERGILAFGAYVPRRRLQRSAIHEANKWFAPGLGGLAKGERSVANWDEDAITMAVEASRDCLSGLNRDSVDSIALASTTHPYANRLNAGIVTEALTLRGDTQALDYAGTMRAGTSALIDALHGKGARLCVASDLRRASPASEDEMVQGDGAAAMLVGEGAAVAKLIAAHSETVDFVDRFRLTGAKTDYAWEGRWIREEGVIEVLGGAIRTAIERAGLKPEDIDRAVIALSVAGALPGLAKATGLRAEVLADTLSKTVGDTGVAHPLLMLAAALEEAKPKQRILLAGFGQGADVLIFETTPEIAKRRASKGVRGHLAARAEDRNYMRFLFHRGFVELERGMRAELDQKQPGTTLYRHRKSTLGLVGGRCTKTGTVQFPKSDVSVNPNEPAIGTQEDYPLAEKMARVVTFTADNLTYSPDPPTFYGAIDFEGGGRMVAEFAEASSDNVEVGRAVRMVFRIKAADEQRGFIKYFWKAVPLDQGDV